MEMGHEGAALRTKSYQLVAQQVGLKAADAKPLNAIHLVECPDQIDELLARGLAKVADVDAREHHFTASFGCSLSGLPDKRLYGGVARESAG